MSRPDGLFRRSPHPTPPPPFRLRPAPWAVARGPTPSTPPPLPPPPGVPPGPTSRRTPTPDGARASSKAAGMCVRRREGGGAVQQPARHHPKASLPLYPPRPNSLRLIDVLVRPSGFQPMRGLGGGWEAKPRPRRFRPPGAAVDPRARWSPRSQVPGSPPWMQKAHHKLHPCAEFFTWC